MCICLNTYIQIIHIHEWDLDMYAYVMYVCILLGSIYVCVFYVSMYFETYAYAYVYAFFLHMRESMYIHTYIYPNLSLRYQIGIASGTHICM